MFNNNVTCINLKDNEYASVIADSLIEDSIEAITTNKQTVAIFSPPGSGKSVLLTEKVKKMTDFGLHTVIVTPTIHLGNMINVDLNAERNLDGLKYTDIAKRTVVTTPDGLGEVLKRLEDNHINFELYVDEIHERIDSAENRKVFDNVDKAISSKYCLASFLFTGTEDVVKHYYNFTKVYKIEKKGKRVINNPKVINLNEMSNQNIKDCVEYAYLNYRKKDGQLFIFLNDKKKHQYIDENIDLNIFENSSIDTEDILYISSNTKHEEYIKEIIKNKSIPENYKIIIITSSASAGIEFFLNKPATVMVFCHQYTFNIRQEVQSTVRVRTDLENLIFVKSKDKIEKSQYIKYDDFFKSRIDKYKEILESKIYFWETLKNMNYLKTYGKKTKQEIAKIINSGNEDFEDDEGCSIALEYIEEKDTFEIKEVLLHKYIADEYAHLILKSTDNFIECMKEQCTQFDFENQTFEIINQDDIFKDRDITKAIEQVLEPESSSATDPPSEENKDNIKNEILKIKDRVNKYDLTIEEKIDIVKDEKEKLPSRVLHSSFYKYIKDLETLDTTFKVFRQLLLLTSDTKYFSEYMIENATTYKLNKYIKEEKFKMKVYTAYYLEEEKDLRQIKKHPKDVQEIYYILKFYKKGKDKKYPYRKVTVSDKTQRALLKYLQSQGLYKGKDLTGDTEKKLLKSTNELFVYESSSKSKSKSSSKRISSLRYIK